MNLIDLLALSLFGMVGGLLILVLVAYLVVTK